MPESTPQRGHRKLRQGMVVSDKMTKTIVVRTERRIAHRRYRKIVTRYSRFFAHDEEGKAKVGDLVQIQETRPLSKNKSWRLVEILHVSKETSANV